MTRQSTEVEGVFISY